MITKELMNAKPLEGKQRLGAFRNSEYMGAEDFEPDSSPVLTIKALYNAKITLARGKEQHDVIVFEEETVPGCINQVRPLVVNATNRKTLRKLFKGVTAEQLVGKRIQLYLQHNVRDPSSGDMVDGIRIRPTAPSGKAPAPIICADCGNPIKPFGNFTADALAKNTTQKYGVPLCVECGKKRKEIGEQMAAEKAAKAEQNETNETETNKEE